MRGAELRGEWERAKSIYKRITIISAADRPFRIYTPSARSYTAMQPDDELQREFEPHCGEHDGRFLIVRAPAIVIHV